MNLDKIKSALNQFLDEKQLKLFEITYQKNDEVLTVLLDETLNMDQLEKVSNDISVFLDQYEDEFKDNYFLDVSNVGAERPIRNESELLEAVNKYIYVKANKQEYYGYLKDYDKGIMTLQVKDKNRSKDIQIDYKDAKKVRYAVEF